MLATPAFVVRVVLAVLSRPTLVPTAIRQTIALVPRRWWASGSRLPFPRRDYLAFRNVTLSGDPDRLPSVEDVVVYLEWCKSMRALPAQP